MSDYVAASEALERLHHDLVATREERDGLLGTLRLIGSEAIRGGDPLLTCQAVSRLVGRALEAHEARTQETGR